MNSPKRSQSNEDKYNIVVLGTAGSGKSCVTIRFIANRFLEEHEPTIQDNYRKDLIYEDQPVTIDILDTAGTDDLSLIRDQYTKSAEGFLFLFALTDESSFREVTKLYDHVNRLLFGEIQENLPSVLLGNKSDLENDRVITSQQGKELANSLNIPVYLESSAKSGENIQTAFVMLVNQIRKKRLEQQVLSKSNPLVKSNSSSKSPEKSPKSSRSHEKSPKSSKSPEKSPKSSKSPEKSPKSSKSSNNSPISKRSTILDDVQSTSPVEGKKKKSKDNGKCVTS